MLGISRLTLLVRMLEKSMRPRPVEDFVTSFLESSGGRRQPSRLTRSDCDQVCCVGGGGGPDLRGPGADGGVEATSAGHRDHGSALFFPSRCRRR